MNEQAINKGLMIAGGLLGLGILGYLFFREKEEQVEEAEFTIVESTTPKVEKPVKAVVVKKPIVLKKVEDVETPKPEVVAKPNDDFPLKLGSKGKRVEQLQVYLLRNYGSFGIITDDFSETINERVSKFLKVDEVSEELFAKLNMDGNKSNKADGTKEKH